MFDLFGEKIVNEGISFQPASVLIWKLISQE